MPWQFSVMIERIAACIGATSKPVPNGIFSYDMMKRYRQSLKLAPAVWIGGLMVIGLGLRLWFLAVNQIDPRFSAADDGDYYLRALQFVVSGQYQDNSWLVRPPGHIFFFAVLLRIGLAFGDPAIGITLIRVVQLVMSLVLIPVGYDLARRLFDQRTGFIFALLLAIWFPFVELPVLILSEPLFFFMLCLHAWMLVRWRDEQHTGWLIGAGVALALAALARSPGLYGALFAVIFISVHIWRTVVQHRFRSIVVALLSFLLPFVLTIAPWTIRNYLVYHDIILVDTLGPVNLWIAVSDAVNEGRGEGEAKGILLRIPQADRQRFVSAELWRIAQTEPWRFTRNIWPHFRHIWKAQFLEDFLVKTSFFARPLRAIWLVGVIGDLLWLAFTLAAPIAFCARWNDGAFRLLALGWIGYTWLMVALTHVEPRYLLPVWLWFALYGAAAIARSNHWLRRFDRLTLVGLLISGVLAGLIFSYRDYPQLIRAGLAREQAWLTVQQALARNDSVATEEAFQAMLSADPDFADGRAEFARWLLAQGRYDEAWQVIGNQQTHRANLIRGALARAQGDNETAATHLRNTEERSGEDIQRLALAWLPLPPTSSLTLGNDLDLGYLYGFALGERAGEVTFRWLQGEGVIRLPLPKPLTGRETLVLRLTAPTPTALTVTIADQRYNFTVMPGGWRNYQLPLPVQAHHLPAITIALRAPTFLPYTRYPNNLDARPLSVMVQHIAVR